MSKDPKETEVLEDSKVYQEIEVLTVDLEIQEAMGLMVGQGIKVRQEAQVEMELVSLVQKVAKEIEVCQVFR